MSNENMILEFKNFIEQDSKYAILTYVAKSYGIIPYWESKFAFFDSHGRNNNGVTGPSGTWKTKWKGSHFILSKLRRSYNIFHSTMRAMPWILYVTDYLRGQDVTWWLL